MPHPDEVTSRGGHTLIIPVENGWIVMLTGSERGMAGARWVARTPDELAAVVLSLQEERALTPGPSPVARERGDALPDGESDAADAETSGEASAPDREGDQPSNSAPSGAGRPQGPSEARTAPEDLTNDV